jgi:hypothetical protein
MASFQGAVILAQSGNKKEAISLAPGRNHQLLGAIAGAFRDGPRISQ